MVDILFQIFGYVAIAWFITHAEPIQNALDNTAIFITEYLKTVKGGKIYFFAFDILYTILGCWMCLSFWLTLTLSASFTTACIASLIAYLLPDDTK